MLGYGLFDRHFETNYEQNKIIMYFHNRIVVGLMYIIVLIINYKILYFFMIACLHQLTNNYIYNTLNQIFILQISILTGQVDIHIYRVRVRVRVRVSYD